MRLIYLPLLAGLMTIGACSSPPKTADTPTPFTPEAARQRAQRDFAEGRPKIYSAGGYAIFEPGIADDLRALVAKLPRDRSLAGRTNPKVRYSIRFATAYNQEIVSFLQSHYSRSAESRIPRLSAERMAQFRRELAQLEKTFFDDQRKDDQFGDHFWRVSKRLADRSGADIIPAVAAYCRKWHGEEPLIFVPLVALLPRGQTLAILHEIERSGHKADRGFAHEFLIELDMSDTSEAVRRFSK